VGSFEPLLVTSISYIFPHRWAVSLAKHSAMIFINVLENLITVGMQSRQWDSTVFNDAEEVGK